MQNSTCDLINVCLDDLVSTVETASVTADGHSPSNLISGDFRARYKGFRVEHYIRPPVTLELELRVPMCISHILLCPDLPQGAEMKVELNGSMGRGLSWCRLSPGVISVKSDMILVLRNKQLHRNVGQELLSVPRLSRMVHRSFASTDLERLGLIDCALKYTNILQHLKCLELRVVKWSGHKPVTFKWMEIWGIASKNCSKEENILFQTIRTAPNSSNESFNRPPGLFKRAGEEFSPQPAVQHLTPPANKMNSKACTSNKAMAISNDSSSTDVASNSSNSIEFGQDMVVSSKGLCMEQVPERFLDEITFEVMTLPMLLPSGHCVDQSTLDKLAQNDTARGRSPSDPFTGVPLTESCKPKFCAELKSQLDRYFSVNKGVGSGRTLGSSRDIQKHLLKSQANVASLLPASKRLKLTTPWKPSSGCTPYKATDVESEHPASTITVSMGSDHAPSLPSHCSNHTPYAGKTSDRMPSRASSFESEVDSSLDQALHQLLHKKRSD